MGAKEEVLTLHVTITGWVQGVGYRYWTLQQAQTRQLSGWVRNRRDGSVEALFSGRRDAVEAMIAACRHGPYSAQVDDVVSAPADAPQHPGFEMLPTP
ncbi:MAG: acylphosphatase [Paludibacterium sp.]|uniref:acylphosphatase n=1 Tax=Paludibacterium sp. TaxID=1917523 RepID=UPI0025EB8EE8|nr:acylphosphatase [Paludibacterium sp.]MBV8048552.1 acylphosphatase [Paludibacterium sp.]